MNRTLRAKRFGEAAFFQGATLARFLQNRKRRCAVPEKLVHVTRQRLYRLPQLVFERDWLPSLRAAVVNRAFAHVDREHLFQTQSLSAELDAIGKASGLITAALVLNGIGPPVSPATFESNAGFAGFYWLKLDDIRLARKPQAERMKGNSAPYEDAGSGFDVARVRLLMEHVSFRRKAVFFPDAFDLHERPAALTERHMLEARERQEFIFREHASGRGRRCERIDQLHPFGQLRSIHRGRLVIRVFARTDNAVFEAWIYKVEQLMRGRFA